MPSESSGAVLREVLGRTALATGKLHPIGTCRIALAAKSHPRDPMFPFALTLALAEGDEGLAKVIVRRLGEVDTVALALALAFDDSPYLPRRLLGEAAPA